MYCIYTLIFFYTVRYISFYEENKDDYYYWLDAFGLTCKVVHVHVHVHVLTFFSTYLL